MRSALTTLLVALLVSAMGLSACGRKGPLEKPPKVQTSNAEAVEGVSPSKPNRRFILDRLLQ
jgi:predicted small lipoprotein YifL